MSKGTLHRWGWRIALACLLVRGLVPAGFMPGDLLAGEVAAPCPTGFPAAFFEPAANTSDHDGPHGSHHGHHPATAPGGTAKLDAAMLDNACPLGQALPVAVIPPVHAPGVPRVQGPLIPPLHTTTIALRRPVNGHPSRAPPLFA